MTSDQEIDKGLLNLKIIWFAMLISLVIYLVLGLYAGINFGPSMKEDAFGILRTLLYIVTFITLIATRYIRKLVLSMKGPYQRSSQTFEYPTLQRYRTAMVIALAMSESIGIYGLVLFFLGKNPIDLYLLILISAGAIFMNRPRREEVIHLVRDAQEDSSTSGAIS